MGKITSSLDDRRRDHTHHVLVDFVVDEETKVDVRNRLGVRSYRDRQHMAQEDHEVHNRSLLGGKVLRGRYDEVVDNRHTEDGHAEQVEEESDRSGLEPHNIPCEMEAIAHGMDGASNHAVDRAARSNHHALLEDRSRAGLVAIGIDSGPEDVRAESIVCVSIALKKRPHPPTYILGAIDYRAFEFASVDFLHRLFEVISRLVFDKAVNFSLFHDHPM